jgi:hypothetical protein
MCGRSLSVIEKEDTEKSPPFCGAIVSPAMVCAGVLPNGTNGIYNFLSEIL